MTSCQNEQSYQAQDIEIYQNQKQKSTKASPQIGGLYEVVKEADIYSDMDDKSNFDKIEANSIVKITSENEDGFIRVEYNGDSFYIKTKYLKEI